jgi:hypothetical protein
MEAIEYRQLAKSARREAAKAVSRDDKMRWLQVAEEWEQLAITAEEREQRYARGRPM